MKLKRWLKLLLRKWLRGGLSRPVYELCQENQELRARVQWLRAVLKSVCWLTRQGDPIAALHRIESEANWAINTDADRETQKLQPEALRGSR